MPRTFLTSLSRYLLCALLVCSVAAAQTVSADHFNGLKWRLIGPFRGGRSVAVAGVPGDSRTFYFGGVDGGVWKTTDAGTVWRPISDSINDPSIGALAVAPSDANTIYAGTGESDIRSDLSSGSGVYRSSDAGRSWQKIGLEDTRQISRIVVDPRDAKTVYVAALGHAYGSNEQRGVFKSSDGGVHWARSLDLGPSVGTSDLAICAGDPTMLFAGAWNAHRPPWSTYPAIDGPGGGLYRSRDAGRSWQRLTGNGLPEDNWGRVGVAVASDCKRIYALISAKQSGLYRSDDGGDHWTLANADARLTSRAWYFNGITVDPSDADTFYVPNVALYGSHDGGKTIYIVRGAPGGDDYHQIWVDPKNSASMVLGTDQGTTISLDRGETWSTWYNQATAQIYHLSTDDQFPYAVYGTQQDSGTVAVYSRTDHGLITPRDWFPAGESESGYILPDPKDPYVIYVTGAYGGVSRYDRRTGFSQDVSPWPSIQFMSEINSRKYRAPWTPPLAFSPIDKTTLYFGTQFVMSSPDGGLSWKTISPDLTGADANAPKDGPATVENARGRGYGVVFSIAPSPKNDKVIWAGSDTGMVHVTRDGGVQWKNVSPPGLSAWSKISMIEASHFDAGTAYAAVDRSRLDDRKPYLFRTRDYGATWQQITDGLRDPAFLRSVREDPQSKGLLFAGTEAGIYISFDDGDHWQPLQLNLPVASVRDIAIHGDDLIVATHGRSFWVLDDFASLRESRQQPDNGFVFYRPSVAFRIDNDGFSGTPFPPEEPTAENPPAGAILDYYLKSSASGIQLEIFDSQHNLIRHFSSDKKLPGHPPMPIAERWFPKPQILEKSPGMHRFVWDLAWYGGTEEPDEDSGRAPKGPRVVPGDYVARLTVDGKSQSQTLTVKMDPRALASPDALRTQYELARKIMGDVNNGRKAMAEVESAQKGLADAKKAASVNGKQEAASAIDKMSASIGNILSGGGPDRPGLREALSDVSAALATVESGDREVPSQALELYKESSHQLAAATQQWETLKKESLPQLDEELKKQSIGPVKIGEIEREVEYLMTR